MVLLKSFKPLAFSFDLVAELICCNTNSIYVLQTGRVMQKESLNQQGDRQEVSSK